MQILKNRLLDEGITENYKRIASVEIFIIIFLFLFFSLHLLLNTGFFTPKFESSNFLILYGLLFLNLGTILLRLKFNSKNSTRPLRMLSNILTATGLLIIFLSLPFDPDKFGEVIPFIGGFLSELLVMNIIGEFSLLVFVFLLLIFLFTIFGIYDAILIYLMNRNMNFESSVENSNNNRNENSS
ncbi:MAG: hypothetical protein ACW967_00650 [Candidatus Hodarchaeales archaeon]